jgi:cytochrome c oxidase cbb3-type subunit 3
MLLVAPSPCACSAVPAYARKVPYPPEPALQPLSPGDIGDVVSYLLALEGRAPVSEASQRGGALFVGRGGCYDCHGPDAHGDPGVGAPNLADRIWLYGSGRPQEIFDSIAYGRAGVCPAWAGRLEPARIREIALYVRSLSAAPAPTSARVP